jgi:hypothetical protein
MSSPPFLYMVVATSIGEIRLLVGEKKPPGMSSICGMGGLGGVGCPLCGVAVQVLF